MQFQLTMQFETGGERFAVFQDPFGNTYHSHMKTFEAAYSYMKLFPEYITILELSTKEAFKQFGQAVFSFNLFSPHDYAIRRTFRTLVSATTDEFTSDCLIGEDAWEYFLKTFKIEPDKIRSMIRQQLSTPMSAPYDMLNEKEIGRTATPPPSRHRKTIEAMLTPDKTQQSEIHFHDYDAMVNQIITAKLALEAGYTGDAKTFTTEGQKLFPAKIHIKQDEAGVTHYMMGKKRLGLAIADMVRAVMREIGTPDQARELFKEVKRRGIEAGLTFPTDPNQIFSDLPELNQIPKNKPTNKRGGKGKG